MSPYASLLILICLEYLYVSKIYLSCVQKCLGPLTRIRLVYAWKYKFDSLLV